MWRRNGGGIDNQAQAAATASKKMSVSNSWRSKRNGVAKLTKSARRM